MDRPFPLPFVFVNMSMTADGKIATANRAVASFGSPRDQEHLYALRATADAVLCGARTIDAGDADLGPGPARFRRRRVAAGRPPHPIRVIASGSGSIRPQARIFRSRASPLLVLVSAQAGATRLRRLQGLADAVHVCGESEIDVREALAWLRRDWGVQRLLCEGGGELNDALFQAGVVDELHLTLCPFLFGGRAAPTLAEGRGAESLHGATQLRLRSARRHGDELFLVYGRATPRAAPLPTGSRGRAPQTRPPASS